MSQTLKLTIKSEDIKSFNQQLSKLDKNQDREIALALSKLFKDLASKNKRASIEISTSEDAPIKEEPITVKAKPKKKKVALAE